MKFDDYQEEARDLAVYPGIQSFGGLVYAALGLNGEAGEVGDHVKKAMRDDDGEITEEREEKLLNEMGDTLWYLAAVASELGYTLSSVAKRNLDKLNDRRMRGTLKGDGDDR